MTKVHPNMILSQLSRQLDVVMLSTMNTSKPASIVLFVTLIVLLAGACGTIPPEQADNVTATSAPTFTPVPPTLAQSPTPEFVTIPATVMPTQTPIPILTPDAIQVNRWREYQTELAKSIIPHMPPELVLCEWFILGQSSSEIYVWAVCDGGGRAYAPAIIYLATDGSIQNVKSVGYGSTRNSEIQRLFPVDIQEKIFSELTSIIDEQLKKHLEERQRNPENPPLIILSAMPTVTPTP